MQPTPTLLERNRQFADRFDGAALPMLPHLRTVVLTCGDPRVDPAHVLGLELGEAAVMRNNGGRVTTEVLHEIAAIAFLVGQLECGEPGPFHLILLQHTECGAERFADPQLQRTLHEKLGVDVAPVAIHDHEESLRADVERLRAAPEIPGYIVVSGLLYDVHTGRGRVVVPPAPLAD